MAAAGPAGRGPPGAPSCSASTSTTSATTVPGSARPPSAARPSRSSTPASPRPTCAPGRKELGLRTWDKPAAACLASRLPYGTPVTLGRLGSVERAEAGLRALGFAELRVRHHGDVARIEVPVDDLDARASTRGRRSWPRCRPPATARSPSTSPASAAAASTSLLARTRRTVHVGNAMWGTSRCSTMRPLAASSSRHGRGRRPCRRPSGCSRRSTAAAGPTPRRRRRGAAPPRPRGWAGRGGSGRRTSSGTRRLRTPTGPGSARLPAWCACGDRRQPGSTIPTTPPPCAGYADALADAVVAALPGWVERVGVVAVRGLGRPRAPAARCVDDARAAGQQAVAEVEPPLRGAARHGRRRAADQPARHRARAPPGTPPRCCAAAGVPPVVRDADAERLFPDDVYDLGPAAFADLDPSVHEPGCLGRRQGARAPAPASPTPQT